MFYGLLNKRAYAEKAGHITGLCLCPLSLFYFSVQVRSSGPICSPRPTWVEKITALSGAAGGRYTWSFWINQRKIRGSFPTSAKKIKNKKNATGMFGEGFIFCSCWCEKNKNKSAVRKMLCLFCLGRRCFTGNEATFLLPLRYSKISSKSIWAWWGGKKK